MALRIAVAVISSLALTFPVSGEAILLSTHREVSFSIQTHLSPPNRTDSVSVGPDTGFWQRDFFGAQIIDIGASATATAFQKSDISPLHFSYIGQATASAAADPGIMGKDPFATAASDYFVEFRLDEPHFYTFTGTSPGGFLDGLGAAGMLMQGTYIIDVSDRVTDSDASANSFAVTNAGFDLSLIPAPEVTTPIPGPLLGVSVGLTVMASVKWIKAHVQNSANSFS